MPDVRNGSVVQFGAFELCHNRGELRKQGIKIRLQAKPLQLLQALLEHPGEVVSREELRQRLWPDDFVDFESGLNTAVNRLRLALGDSAEHPRYVETVARTGYRFLPPVSEIHAAAVSQEINGTTSAPPAHSTAQPWPPKWLVAWVLAGAGLAFAGLILALRPQSAPQLSFHQVTFGRTAVSAARFTPDGESVIYEAHETLSKSELYLANLLSPESRPLGFPGARLASISRSGELALMLYDSTPRLPPKLVRVPLNGGAPLPIDQGLSNAEWSPDGSAMAAIRFQVRPSVLEFPRGHIIYKSSGWLSHVRIAPSGEQAAFIEHLIRGDDAGDIKVIDSGAHCRTLAAGWATAQGLAWSPSGREVWFTAARCGMMRSLYAVTLAGRIRLIASFPGMLTLYDISRSGRVLISQEQMRVAMSGCLRGEKKEKNLSWFDYSHVVDMAADGSAILFDETGEGGGARHAAYVRRAGASSAARVGDGWAKAISPDANWAITMSQPEQTSINLIPLGPGQSHTLSGQGLRYDWVRFFPQSRRLLVGGNLPGKGLQLFIQDLDGGHLEALNTSDYIVRPAISPNEQQLAGFDTEGRLVILPIAGGSPRIVAAKLNGMILAWSSDGKALLAQASGSIPAAIARVDLATGRSKPWKELGPGDLSGVTFYWPVVFSRDEQSYAYSVARDLSELFVVEGWR